MVYSVLTVILIVAHIVVSTPNDSSKYCECDEALINRRGFPDGFIFGSSSSAYQVEGGYNLNGKGPSMWENFTHAYPERIRDHSTGDLAVDSYHLYKEDVKILKEMGVDAYRFSVSWSRILPGGTISGGVNQDGIDYYNNLINELIANGIQPWITILHMDTPRALQDAYGGFLNSQIVSDFQDFADLLFSQFGDRVKYWITINEPSGFSYLGYVTGQFAPGRCSKWTGHNSTCIGGDAATEPYIVTHNQLLAHAAAVNLYRTKYLEAQEGKIGIVVDTFWFVPYDETYEGVETKDRAYDFLLGWIMDPIMFGRYPKSMRTRVGDRLPEFTEEEIDTVKGSLDFLGVNYYSAKYVVNLDQPTDSANYITDSGYFSTGVKDGVLIGEKGSNLSPYNIYPKGLRRILQHIKLKYNDPVIYITENGFDEDRNDSLPMSEALKDYKRKDYFFDHLCCLHEAIKQDGANVKGYFAWSLTDNFEWTSGYLVRFGLHYVDFRDKCLTRHAKFSAKWLKTIFARTTRISDH